MRHLIAALAAAALVLPTAPPAQAITAVGVSLGLAQLDKSQPLNFNSYHTTSNFRFRWEALSPYTEMMFGFVNRAQALSANKAYVFDTSGVSLSAGAHWGFLRGGVGVEAAWLRAIVQDSSSVGQLRFHNGGGFIIEPYLGVILPILRSEVTELELSVHVPVYNGVDTQSIGPRVLLTMWLGGEGDDEEETEDPTDPEETDPEAPPGDPLPDEKPPAPKPAATPAPAKPVPAKPAKPKPVRKGTRK